MLSRQFPLIKKKKDHFSFFVTLWNVYLLLKFFFILHWCDSSWFSDYFKVPVFFYRLLVTHRVTDVMVNILIVLTDPKHPLKILAN